MASSGPMDVTAYFENVLGTSNMVRISFAGQAHARMDASRGQSGKGGKRGSKGKGGSGFRSTLADAGGLREGRLDEDTLAALLNDGADGDRGAGKGKEPRKNGNAKGSGAGGRSDPDELKVILVPHSVKAAGTSEHEALLCIPAVASLRRGERGVLSYPGDWTGDAPWMPRPLLREPTRDTALDATKAETLFGSYEAYERFVRGKADRRTYIDQLEGAAQWHAYLDYCADLYDAATEGETPLDSEESQVDDGIYVLVNDTVNAAVNVVRLYGEIRKALAASPGDPALSLYRNVTSIDDPHHVPVHAGETVLDEVLGHCGTMSRDYPLAPSQRSSVHAFGKLAEGQVLAVSGPPGTGKTTLLESIVADLLVRSALAGDDAPVIVGTSTNNQAVSNIIDAFGKIEQDPWPSAFARWLPDIFYEAIGDDAPGKDQKQASYKPGYDDERPLHSLGAYSPSAAKAAGAKAGNYLICDLKRDGNSLYGMALDPDFSKAEHAPRVYLEQGAAHFGLAFAKPRNLRDACRAELQAVDGRRRALARAVAAGKVDSARDDTAWLARHRAGDAESWDAAVRDGALESLAKLDQAFDTLVRPLEFWLAVHYYEGVWLATRNQVPPNPKKGVEEGSARDRKSKSVESVRYYHHHLAALMPIQVMTVYRLPNQHACLREKGSEITFDLGSIDLLIVDEAGQVDTSVGAAAFSLAKRAVVVGDAQQLEPVWGLEPEVDRQIAERFMGGGTLGKDGTWNALQARSLTASRPSSLILAAEAACPWSHLVPTGDDDEYDDDPQAGAFEEGGLFLSEHRRCLDEIVSYCNDLVYEGQLEPMRGNAAKARKAQVDLPPMGMCPVESRSTRSGTSRVNLGEARAIARWIAARLPEIYDAYRAASKDAAPDPAKLVGVVTPFAAQAWKVKQALRDKQVVGQLARAFDGTDRPKIDARALVNAVTVGTAHKLQGAECPVVLFSLVYGAQDNPGFVESNPNLMNVAVSRAKDSFIVFGSRKLLESQSGDGVMSLLKYYCCPNSRHPERLVAPAEEAEEAPASGEEAATPAGAEAAAKPVGAEAAATPGGAEAAATPGGAEAAIPARKPATERAETSSTRRSANRAASLSTAERTNAGRSAAGRSAAGGNAAGRSAARRGSTGGTAAGRSKTGRTNAGRSTTAMPHSNADIPTQPDGSKPLSLTKAVQRAQVNDEWPQGLPVKAVEINKLLVDAGLLVRVAGGQLRPTDTGRNLGIGVSQPGKDGAQWPVFTESALRKVAELLQS